MALLKQNEAFSESISCVIPSDKTISSLSIISKPSWLSIDSITLQMTGAVPENQTRTWDIQFDYTLDDNTTGSHALPMSVSEQTEAQILTLIDDDRNYKFTIDKVDLANGLSSSVLEYGEGGAKVTRDWFLTSNDLEPSGFQTLSGDDTPNEFQSTSANEKFVGGLGADTYTFTRSEAYDLGINEITDFNVEEDKLIFNGFTYSEMIRTVDNTGASYIKFHQTEAEGDELTIATNARPTKLMIDNFFQTTLKFIGTQEVYLQRKVMVQ